MFSSIKIEKYMEPELSGIFGVKLAAKNIVLGSPGSHFMHMMVKRHLFFWYKLKDRFSRKS